MVEKHCFKFPHISVGKESACDSGDPGSIPGWKDSPGEGNGNPLQYSCLENPMDRGAWRAIVHGIARVGHDLTTNATVNITESKLERKTLNYKRVPFYN